MNGICVKCGKIAEVRRHHSKGYNNDNTEMYCRSCDLIAHSCARKNGTCNLTHEQAQIKSKKSYNKNISRKYNISYNSVGRNILLYEDLFINLNTGNIVICSNFLGNHGYKLYILKEVI